MTNILNKSTIIKMQSHIDKAYKFLDAHLPYEYTKDVQNELKKQSVEVPGTVIRNVRNRKNERIEIINALLLVAKRHKKQKEELVKNLK